MKWESKMEWGRLKGDSEGKDVRSPDRSGLIPWAGLHRLWQGGDSSF